MIEFIHDHFLLKTETARRLYHEVAERLPIIDYHNHLDPRDLANDRTFENLTQVWIAGDPYKHRAMRIAGVPERLITGEASDREKFDAWAGTVPQTMGNPLFHWTALELKRYFGITALLSPATASQVWEIGNEMLRSPGFSARGLIARMNVECLCTSDQLQDDLEAHAQLAHSDFSTFVLPSLRVDSLADVDRGLIGEPARPAVAPYHSLADAEPARPAVAPYRSPSVTKRLDFFGQRGCRLADHAVSNFDSVELRFLAGEYAQRSWILQLHIGAQRQTSTRLRHLAGPAGGYATIGNACDIAGLCRFLDDLEKAGDLPRTILYPLNPADYAALATLTGSFTGDGVRGHLQLGPAWWFNDHALGIRQHLDALASYGVLSAFIGMTTDSRSLLSMVRHEYFRRVFCDWLGDQVTAGALPDDDELLGGLVRAVAYENARGWILPENANAT